MISVEDRPAAGQVNANAMTLATPKAGRQRRRPVRAAGFLAFALPALVLLVLTRLAPEAVSLVQ